MSKRNLNLLYDPSFLLALAVLMLNDFILKYAFPGFITGKLSDFAGLYAFAFFFSIFFSKNLKTVYLLTALLFIWWKSPFAQSFIEVFHTIGIGLARVVDMGDLIALSILPISYFVRTQDFARRPISRVPAFFIILISCFAFVATSLPREHTDLNMKSKLEVGLNAPFDTISNHFRQFYTYNDTTYIAVLPVAEHDSEIYYQFFYESDPSFKYGKIRLDSILFAETTGSASFFGGGVKKEDIEYIKSQDQSALEKLFIDKIRRIKVKNL